MASRSRATLIAAVAGIAVAAGAAWWWQQPRTQAGKPTADAPRAASAPGGPGAPGGQGGPVLVEVARVETMALADDAQAVGSLRSRQSVVLRPEVGGRIRSINFRDGERVRRGQLLVQLDDQLPLAQVQQAQAELSIAQANDKRNRELVGEGFVSQRALDESAANLQVAQARLALARATAARLRVVAPFDGVAGIRSVNVGDYLKDGADIVNIEDIDAVYVDFRLPERVQGKLQRGQRATVELDALPGQRFSATVLAIDPLLDANGRSVAVRGCIDNRRRQLRPGMFARVTTVFDARADARVIPEEALVPGARPAVWKVVQQGEQRSAQRVEVQLGLRKPGRVEVLRGLEPADTVVTAGQQRLQRDGTPVRVAPVQDGVRTDAPRQPAAAPQPVVEAAAAGNPCLTAARG